MKHLRKAIWLLALSACGTCTACGTAGMDIPKYTTSHGVKVFCESDDHCWEQEDVETAVAIFAEQLSEAWFPVAIAGIELKLFIGKVPCKTIYPDREHCFGVYRNSREILLTWRECIPRSALSHELGHLVQHKLYGLEDHYHEDTNVFPEACLDTDHEVLSDDEKACLNETLVLKSNRALLKTFESTCLR